MNLSLDFLSEDFARKAYADPRFREAIDIASQNSRGRIWLIGGFLYKSLIKTVYGFDVPAKDFDFVVENVRGKLDLPEGWTSRTNRFGNPELNGTAQIDLIPLGNILYLRKKGLDPTIANYISSVNLNICAMAFDLRNEEIINGGGIEALEEMVIGVHNLEMAEISAKMYNTGVNEMIRKKAGELHFQARLIDE